MVETHHLGHDSGMGAVVWEPIVVRVACAECGRESDPLWRGYRACRIDEPSTNDEPTFAFFCPDCTQREFGL